jgi:hypothetical protein
MSRFFTVKSIWRLVPAAGEARCAGLSSKRLSVKTESATVSSFVPIANLTDIAMSMYGTVAALKVSRFLTAKRFHLAPHRRVTV